MITLRQYQNGDMAKITDPLEPVVITEEQIAILEKNIESGLSVTAEVDGKVLFCSGAIQCSEDKAEFWCRISSQGRKLLIRLCRAVKDSVDIFRDCMPELTFYAHIKEGFQTGRRFAEFLGFKDAGVIEDLYGAKYYLYKLED